MNVLVESNFLLELVFLQEQSSACSELLKLARKRRIRLVIPAFSITEPLDKLHRQRLSRQKIQQEINSEIKQLARSTGFKKRIAELESVDVLLSKSIDDEQKRYEKLTQRLLSIATIIPLDSAVLKSAKTLSARLSLSMQDAIVYASTLTFLNNGPRTPSCFLNRNSKDFEIPEITTELEGLGCRMIPGFVDGLRFVEKRIG